MSLGMARYCYGEEEQDVPLPFLSISVVVFVFCGDRATTGILFEGLPR